MLSISVYHKMGDIITLEALELSRGHQTHPSHYRDLENLQGGRFYTIQEISIKSS